VAGLKRTKSSKHIPEKYRKYKGCFGKSPAEKDEQSNPPEVCLEGELTMVDADFGNIKDSFEMVLTNPETILNMREITGINVSCALLLKAFFDEYNLKYGDKPKTRSPKNQKVRAILNYLQIAHYPDVKRIHYNDIDCWQIRSWDQRNEVEIPFAQILLEQIIPKCWSGRHAMSQTSSNIASFVSEALWNCMEHAYTGKKEKSEFKNLYLGVGEYPGTQRFSFCIYDKGIGIIQRLKDNPEGWLDQIKDLGIPDSKMIEKATQGRSGAVKGKKGGRGNGLKTVVELLNSNHGQLDILSDHGYFSTYSENSGKDRETSLEGTMVAFSFPIKYI